MKKQFLKFISLALIVALCCVFLPTNILAETKVDGDEKEVTSLFLDFQGDSRPSEIISTSTVVTDPVSEFYNDKVLKKGANKSQDIIVNYVFEANKTYNIKFDYFMEVADGATLPYLDLLVDTWNGEKFEWDSNSGKVKGWTPSVANQWIHTEFTYTPTSDKNPLKFRLYTAQVMYIDNLSISEASASVSNGNTVVSQNYDFDNVNFKALTDKLNNIVEMTAVDGKKNFVLKLTPTASAQAKINAELDYALEEGNYYKLSFDYKGSAKMRVLHNFGAWANLVAVDTILEAGPNSGNDMYFNSPDSWKKYDTVFYANQASSHLYFLLIAQSNGSIFIDNIKLEKCDVTGSTVTAFPTKYTVNFEDDTVDSLAVASNAGITLATDPTNENNKVLKHTGAYGSFFVSQARLKAGHDYEITYDYYVPTQTATDIGVRNTLRNSAGAKLSEHGWTDTWSASVKNNWTKKTIKISNTAEGAFLQLYVIREIYIDNIVVRDMTPDSYYTDYEDEEILIEDDTSRTEVTYENDEIYGKVAKIEYKPVSALGGYTKFPVKLRNGEAYKVTFTYKTTAWATVHYSAKTEAAKWGIDSRAWRTVTYYVTGNSDSDYFGFRCNNAQDILNIWIAEVKIERKTDATDLNADGKSDKTDVSLLREYLLTGRNDLKFFEKFTEQNNDEVVNICDLVSFAKKIN